MSGPFLYDFPTPSTAHPISSSPRRKRSQSPRRIPHMGSSSKHYPPSSRQADIFRLLDPAYVSASSSLSSSPTSAYVDHHGEIHDPDYRDFPVSIHRLAVAARPRRESALLEEEDEEAVDDEDDLDIASGSVASSSRFPHRVRPSHHRDSLSSNHRHHQYHYSAGGTGYYYDPAALAFTCDVSPPTSLDSDEIALGESPECPESPFLDDSEKRAPASGSPTSVYSHSQLHGHRMSWIKKERDVSEEQDAPAAAPEEETRGMVSEKPALARGAYVPSSRDDQDWTPTCTQGLWREWQATSLRLRFSLFRAKRKVRRWWGV